MHGLKTIVEVESSEVSEKETAKEDIIINLETNIDQDAKDQEEQYENIIKPEENVEETEADEEKHVETEVNTNPL